MIYYKTHCVLFIPHLYHTSMPIFTKYTKFEIKEKIRLIEEIL